MSGRMTRVFERQKADSVRCNGVFARARGLYRKLFHGSAPPAPRPHAGLKGDVPSNAPVVSDIPTPEPAFSLPERALDGTASSAELRELAARHPGRPEVIRVYARRLSAEAHPDEAAAAFCEAAGLFFDSGRIFQGWLCKVLEWKLRRAPREQLAAVQDVIARSSPRESVDEFVQSLDWSERVAVFSRFSLMWLPPGRVLTPLDGLYAVVAGRLEDVDGGRTLEESAAFGFGGSGADVRSVTGAEVLKISSEHLEAVFARFPQAQVKYRRMFLALEGRRPDARTTRRGERYSIRTIMNVTVAGEAGEQGALMLRGFSHELSVGGVSFMVEQDGGLDAEKDAALLVGRKAQVAIKAEGISLEAQGLIVRTHSIVSDGRKLLCLGIQFVELSPLARSTIFTFAGSANTYSL